MAETTTTDAATTTTGKAKRAGYRPFCKLTPERLLLIEALIGACDAGAQAFTQGAFTNLHQLGSITFYDQTARNDRHATRLQLGLTPQATERLGKLAGRGFLQYPTDSDLTRAASWLRRALATAKAEQGVA